MLQINRITYSHINTEANLYDAWEFYKKEYGRSLVPFRRLALWHEVYPGGTLVASDSEGILASCSAWPIRSHVYRLLTEGELRERQLDTRAFATPSDAIYWYMNAFVVRSDSRRLGVGKDILDKFIQDRHSIKTIGCNALSISGGSFLEQQGFTFVREIGKTFYYEISR